MNEKTSSIYLNEDYSTETLIYVGSLEKLTAHLQKKHYQGFAIKWLSYNEFEVYHSRVDGYYVEAPSERSKYAPKLQKEVSVIINPDKYQTHVKIEIATIFRSPNKTFQSIVLASSLFVFLLLLFAGMGYFTISFSLIMIIFLLAHRRYFIRQEEKDSIDLVEAFKHYLQFIDENRSNETLLN